MIIDKTLITLCQKKANITSIVAVIEALSKAGVDVFEIDSASLQYVTLIMNNCNNTKQVNKTIRSVSFALRLDQNQIGQWHPQVKYVIIPAKEYKVDSAQSAQIVYQNQNHSGVTVILEISIDQFSDVGNGIGSTRNCLQEIIQHSQASILRLEGLSKTLFPIEETSITDIKTEYGVEVDICANNHCYTSTAIAVEAMQLGAEYVTTHFNGGLEQQFTPFEEVVMARAYLLNEDNAIVDDYSCMQTLAKIYERIVGDKIMPAKPIIGEDIFKYESGIHADGIAKDQATYEPYAPELVGKKRQLVIGKHSSSKYRSQAKELS